MIFIIQKKSRRKDKYFDFESDGTFTLKQNIGTNKRIPGSKPLKEILNTDNSDFIDLLEKCLTFDPKKRIKPHIALIHPWIIDELPQEIKHLYLKDCQDLKKEIENVDNQGQTRMIFIEEGLRGKTENSSKDNSVDRKKEIVKHPFLEQKFKDNFTIKKKPNEEKKEEQDLFEKTNSKIIDQNVKVIPDVKKFRQLRKVNYVKKKSITFHQCSEKEYF